MKNKTNVFEEENPHNKIVNLTTYIIYGSILLISIVAWFLLYEEIAKSNKANLLNAIFTTLIANGLVGLIYTFVLNREKDKSLDASIKRISTAIWDGPFVAQGLAESLKQGFIYCNKKVDTFRVCAVSTNQILSYVEGEEGIHIDKCRLMVRGYGDNMSRDEISSNEIKADNEIKANIERWEGLKCLSELNYIQYNNYSLNYYCIFDNKFITFGQYVFDEEKNLHKVHPLKPFSITDQTKTGKKIIENSIEQFESYFNSEKKKRINFNEFANRYDSLRKADKDLIDILIKKCDIKKNAKILDFGCGTGNYIKEFQEQGFKNISGLDTSEKMREIALKKTGATICEQFNDFSEYFDFIFVIDVVHFIKDVHFLAEKLYSKCADKAMVAVVTQSHEQIKKRRYREFFPSAIEMDLKRYHKIDKLTKNFTSVGFNLQKKETFRGNTSRKLDSNFLDKVKNKCFSMFELIDENEFNAGIKKFEEALAKANNNAIEEFYAGKTILLFSKTKAVVSTSTNNLNIISKVKKIFT